MKEIVGIQFKNASRVYYFAPLSYSFEIGEYAIVETVRGLELGKVIIPNRMVEDEDFSYELKPVIRKASNADLATDKHHQELAKSGFSLFKKCVSELNLPMKPLYCEYTIDSSKIIFYYSADDRVDFRELLKMLAPLFKTRVELRQIGPREAARIVGGLGNCGRVICCNSCLNNFDFVTMKMAKEQGMSLNISKISGLCGKLMCCIAFENEMYAELKKEVPNVGELVSTPKCPCTKVVSVDYIKKVVSVIENDNSSPTRYEAKDVNRITVKDPSAPTDLKVDSYVEEKIETTEQNTNKDDSSDVSIEQLDKNQKKQKGKKDKNNIKRVYKTFKRHEHEPKGK